MTPVRLTFAARCRYPDIGTHHGTAALDEPTNGWHRVEWPGERTTWLRATDIEPVATPTPRNSAIPT